VSPRSVALVLGLLVPTAGAQAENLDTPCANDQTCVARLLAHTLTAEQHAIVFHQVVEFEPGRVRVYSKSREKIQALAEAWKTRADWSAITVDGYSGAAARSDAENTALGQRRAERIRDYLIRDGIPGDRIVAVGHADARGERFVDLTLALRTP
jgi:outer membrane protein OmpA-like peptidoglycan-associated protein